MIKSKLFFIFLKTDNQLRSKLETNFISNVYPEVCNIKSINQTQLHQTNLIVHDTGAITKNNTSKIIRIRFQSYADCGTRLI